MTSILLLRLFVPQSSTDRRNMLPCDARLSRRVRDSRARVPGEPEGNGLVGGGCFVDTRALRRLSHTVYARNPVETVMSRWRRRWRRAAELGPARRRWAAAPAAAAPDTLLPQNGF